MLQYLSWLVPSMWELWSPANPTFPPLEIGPEAVEADTLADLLKRSSTDFWPDAQYQALRRGPRPSGNDAALSTGASAFG
jgi:hypothetical protein